MKGYPVLAALLGGGALLVVGMLWSPFDRPAVYAVGVAHFLAERGFDKPVRVRGTLVHGSLCRVEADCGYRFSMVDSLKGNPWTPAPGELLSVSYDACMLPDNFRDLRRSDVQVTAEGQRCRSCHDLEATTVMVWTQSLYRRGDNVPAEESPRCEPRM